MVSYPCIGLVYIRMKPAFPFNDFPANFTFFRKNKEFFLIVPFQITLFTYSYLFPSGGKYIFEPELLSLEQ